MSESDQSYRDALSTVDKKGKRIWLYPKKPSGKYFNKRKIVSYLLLLWLLSAPYIKIGGEQLILLNVLERKFVFFGKVFGPQDFHIFALSMITAVVVIVLFTLVYGRLFCGWICPQTIFMEMLFRRIEYWIEGDRNHQIKLSKMPWNTEKLIKRGGKNILFYLISVFIANTFLAYLIGSDELLLMVQEGPGEHMSTFVSLLIFSFVFYGVFAWLREQVCTTICPYGRLQGVLLDKNSMVVTYDYKRGENRAKFKKNEVRSDLNKGDCIDCNQCVLVCPTGIDIRNGTQLECTNCTACIDACDNMMDAVGLDKGLIRYSSEESIRTGSRFQFSFKAKAYTVVLAILVSVLIAVVAMRNPITSNIFRVRGTDYAKMADGRISNTFNVVLINNSGEGKKIDLKVSGNNATIEKIGKNWYLKEDAEFKGTFLLIKQAEDVVNGEEIQLEIYGDGELLDKEDVKFTGPIL